MKELKNDENKVWVTVAHTINLGNYESVKIEAGYSQTFMEHPVESIGIMTEELLQSVKVSGKRAKKLLKK